MLDNKLQYNTCNEQASPKPEFHKYDLQRDKSSGHTGTLVLDRIVRADL